MRAWSIHHGLWRKNIMDRKKQEQDAVFWCSLLGPVLFGQIPRGQVAGYLRKLACKKFAFPDGRHRRPSVSTLKRKLRHLRKGGLRIFPAVKKAQGQQDIFRPAA